MHPLRAALIASTLLALAPPAAGAATFHVDRRAASGDCSAASPCPTVNEAVTASRANDEVDTIRIAPGLYPERVELMDPKDSGITLEGSGSGSDPATDTILQDGGDAAYLVLVLGSVSGMEANMTARNLRVVNTTSEERGSAVILNAADSVLEDVYATVAAPASDPVIHVRHNGARLDRVTARAVGGPGAPQASGVYADGDDLLVRDSTIEGDLGGGLEVRSDGNLQLVRSRVTAAPTAEYALRTQGTMTADSSVMSGGAVGLLYFGGDVADPDRDAKLRGVTIDAGEPGVADPVTRGDEPSGTYAIALQYDDVDVRLDSSIALERSISYGGEVRCSFSNVPGQEQPADATAGTGPVACGHSVASGNFASPAGALFVDSPGRDYRLAPGSPALDRGAERALEPGESALDLARAPRVGGCIARRDQGAYESACSPPPVVDALPPVVTPPVVLADTLRPLISRASLTRRTFRVGAGTGIRFSLSEAARVRIVAERRLRGRRVGRRCLAPTTRRLRRPRCVRWKRATLLTRSLPAGRAQVRVRSRALRAGRYRFSITATDAAGNTTARPVRLAFRVLRRVKS